MEFWVAVLLFLLAVAGIVLSAVCLRRKKVLRVVCIVICSLLAVGTAVGLYFALRGVLDRETLGWLCIVGAAPMAAAGFFHYNGLTLEQFLWAWCKTNFLLAGRRLWHSENYLYDLWEKEDKK